MLNLDYEELYELSLTHPEKVWDEFAKEVEWSKPYDCVIDDKTCPTPNWFVGGEINMSYNCLDKAIEEGFGDDVAVIYESPVTDTIQKLTFRELLKSVELFAGVLVDRCGVKKGDRVMFYLPVIPECLIGMLACTRIGAIYTTACGGFLFKEISSRIDYMEPKLVITCNIAYEMKHVINYKERVDTAFEQSLYKPKYCIVYNRPNSQPAKMIEERDLDWNTEISLSLPIKSVPLASNHPMFIIFTSGTTGEPKGLVMGTGNSVVTDKYILKYLFGIKEREMWWMYSDFEWITGQTCMTYAPLLVRCKTIFYEAMSISTPDSSEIIKIMNRHKVTSFMSSPTIMRMLRNICHDSEVKLTYEGLRQACIGGEVSNLDLRNWISTTFRCPCYDIFGQTEANGAIISSCMGFKRSSYNSSVLALGYKVKIVDSKTGEELPSETVGEILFKAPANPAFAITLYKNHDRFINKYFRKYPGYYCTFDCGKVMTDGSLVVLGRFDDVVQVCSTRICGGAVEEACLLNKNLINAAVVPLDDSLTGQLPFGFLIKRRGSKDSDEKIIADTIEYVREVAGDLALFSKAVVVPDFPKTKSKKILRHSLSAMINKRVFKVPHTIANPEIYRVIHNILTKAGIESSLPEDI